jgi:hypothetical protein
VSSVYFYVDKHTGTNVPGLNATNDGFTGTEFTLDNFCVLFQDWAAPSPPPPAPPSPPAACPFTLFTFDDDTTGQLNGYGNVEWNGFVVEQPSVRFSPQSCRT